MSTFVAGHCERFPEPPFERPPEEVFEHRGPPPPLPLFPKPEIKTVPAEKIFDPPGRNERPTHVSWGDGREGRDGGETTQKPQLRQPIPLCKNVCFWV